MPKLTQRRPELHVIGWKVRLIPSAQAPLPAVIQYPSLGYEPVGVRNPGASAHADPDNTRVKGWESWRGVRNLRFPLDNFSFEPDGEWSYMRPHEEPGRVYIRRNPIPQTGEGKWYTDLVLCIDVQNGQYAYLVNILEVEAFIDPGTGEEHPPLDCLALDKERLARVSGIRPEEIRL